MNLDICRKCRYWTERVLVDPYRKNVELELTCDISMFAVFSIMFRGKRVEKVLETLFNCKSIEDYYEKVKDIRPYNKNAFDKISVSFKRQYNSTLQDIMDFKAPKYCPYQMEQFVSELNQ